jgi:hypothetical protein
MRVGLPSGHLHLRLLLRTLSFWVPGLLKLDDLLQLHSRLLLLTIQLQTSLSFGNFPLPLQPLFHFSPHLQHDFIRFDQPNCLPELLLLALQPGLHKVPGPADLLRV